MDEVKKAIKDDHRHLAVFPETFFEFRELRGNYKSDDAFVLFLLKLYRRRLEFLEKKRLEAETNV